jgi:hypothetical protein
VRFLGQRARKRSRSIYLDNQPAQNHRVYETNPIWSSNYLSFFVLVTVGVDSISEGS